MQATTCPENFQRDKFQKLLVEYIAQKYLPFNFFEDAISEKVYKYLNPKATLPGRNQMKTLTLNTFEAAQQTIKTFLKTCNSKISFTIDGWSSFNMKGYYGITAHFIDKNWKLHSILLDFVAADGQHTGNAIAKLFFQILQFYDVTRCVQGITTDNTNSNFTFIRELKKFICDIDTKNIHFVCFAHILNLGARDFMKILDSEVEEAANILTDSSASDDDDCQVSSSSVRKIHSLAKKIKNSEHLRKDFDKFCTTLNLKITMPKLDVMTRWNSTFDMLRWSLNMKKALNILCDNVENLNNLKPTDTEWSLIERICQYLTVFKSISTVLEGESYATLPMVIIGINMLLDRLESWAMELDNKPDRCEIDVKIINSIQAARDKIIKHYDRSNWMYCVVLILDPRHKVETFSHTSWGKELQIEGVKHFEDIFRAKYFRADSQPEPIFQSSVPSASSTHPSEHSGAEKFDIDLLSLFSRKSIHTKDGMAWRYEIDKYISDPRADSSEDILEWWKRHECIFPNLATMAKDFLPTPASSAPVERQFSRAALTLTKTRNRLGDNSVRSLMCLKSWMANEVIKDLF